MDNMIKIHEEARNSISSLYHIFISKYERGKQEIYAFVEGKEDYSYYNHNVKLLLPRNWELNLWTSGSKSNVISIYNSLDWSRFCPHCVLFFVDRDFSEYLGETHPIAPNFYVTDYYSFDNCLVNSSCLKEYLKQIYDFRDITDDEFDVIIALFNKMLDKFYDYIAEIIAWVLAWMKNGKKPCLNNINMKHLFEIKQDRIIKKKRPDECRGATTYLSKKLRMSIRGYAKEKDRILLELRKAQPKTFVRGKFELWYFIEFASYIHDNYDRFCSALKGKRKPKCYVSISQRNATLIISPLSKMPESLEQFLTHNITRCAS